MSRRLECDTEGGEIRILFPYDKTLVGVVRGLPGRRWHKEDRFWSVPRRHLSEALQELLPLGFSASDEIVALADEDPKLRLIMDQNSSAASASNGEPDLFSGISDEAAPTGARAEVEEPTISISELNERVRATLSRAYPEELWVVGEIIGFDRNAHKRHVYFQLAEKHDGEDRPRAVVTAVLFSGTRDSLEQRLERGPEPVALADGVRVRMRGRVDLYPPTGSYQFIVEDVDPEFMLGEIARRRERILLEITKLGLHERNLLIPFPRPCLRVALVTSFESDAYNDFVNELMRAGLAFEVDVYDVHVQGARVEPGLLAALGHIQEHAVRYDAVVIVRGGGARTDLMGFDSLSIGLAVARLDVKVLVGIGHHRDRSVLDAIAHSEKTPTAVGQLLVALAQREIEQLTEVYSRLLRTADGSLRSTRDRLGRVATLMERSVRLRVEREWGRLRMRARDVATASAKRLEERRFKLRRARERFASALPRRLRSAQSFCQHSGDRLAVASRRRLERTQERLDNRQARVRAADPARLLASGYAWLRDADGRTIKSTGDTESGAKLEARLADGTLDLRVE